MATTPEQIEIIREFCEKLRCNPKTLDVVLNDWGRHGNFEVHLYPKNPTDAKTARVKSIVAQALRGENRFHVRQIIPPDLLYAMVWSDKAGRMMLRRCGYAWSYWAIDLDFQEYDDESNTFKEVDHA